MKVITKLLGDDNEDLLVLDFLYTPSEIVDINGEDYITSGFFDHFLEDGTLIRHVHFKMD